MPLIIVLTTDAVENLILEHLKALRAVSSDIRSELRGVKAPLVSLENQVAQLDKSTTFLHEDLAAAVDAPIDGLGERLERVERRLNIVAAP